MLNQVSTVKESKDECEPLGCNFAVIENTCESRLDAVNGLIHRRFVTQIVDFVSIQEYDRAAGDQGEIRNQP